MSGGAIMDDFDNDGLLDLVVTSSDPTQPMALYRNKGDGTFEERTAAAGLSEQLGGLYCVQTDYNNDGWLDIFIIRGAWFSRPCGPSCCTTTATAPSPTSPAAGLLDPVNSISAAWADYDNDGWLDLFVGCEKQPNRLYHNKGDGTFEEVAAKAGVHGDGRYARAPPGSTTTATTTPTYSSTISTGPPQLFHNNRDGTFTDVTEPWASRARARLLLLGVGLRQRRLAGHLRHLSDPRWKT